MPTNITSAGFDVGYTVSSGNSAGKVYFLLDDRYTGITPTDIIGAGADACKVSLAQQGGAETSRDACTESEGDGSSAATAAHTRQDRSQPAEG